MFSWWRARKKKALINLPFVNRTIRKVPSKPSNYQQKEASQAIVQESKEEIKKPTPPVNSPKENNTPEGSTSPAKLIDPANLILSNSISINAKTLNQEKEKIEKDAVQVNRPTADYTVEEFKTQWNIYKKQLHQKGKISLVTVFEEIPSINNHNIDLMVENKALEDEFNHYKADFLDFIRDALNNFNIQVTIQINKEFKTKVAYTPQEKYDKMKDKNPALELLRKKLDMDVGY